MTKYKYNFTKMQSTLFSPHFFVLFFLSRWLVSEHLGDTTSQCSVGLTHGSLPFLIFLGH